MISIVTNSLYSGEAEQSPTAYYRRWPAYLTRPSRRFDFTPFVVFRRGGAISNNKPAEVEHHILSSACRYCDMVSEELGNGCRANIPEHRRACLTAYTAEIEMAKRDWKWGSRAMRAHSWTQWRSPTWRNHNRFSYGFIFVEIPCIVKMYTRV